MVHRLTKQNRKWILPIRKQIKVYIGITVWALLLCGMVAFWITESTLIIQARKNGTEPGPRLVQVNTILDTMMMDQVHNTTFQNAMHFNKETDSSKKIWRSST